MICFIINVTIMLLCFLAGVLAGVVFMIRLECIQKREDEEELKDEQD